MEKKLTGRDYTLSYNQCHVILRLFDVSPNFPFITSETMCLKPRYIRVASRVAEQLKILRKTAQSPCQNESFVNTRKKLLKNRNYKFPVVHYFTRKLELVPDIL